MKQNLIINRLYSVVCHLSTVFAPLHLSRTLYKSATFYAKQTQFAGCSNERILLCNNGLWKWNRLPASKKQTQSVRPALFAEELPDWSNPISVKKSQNKLLLWFGVENDIILAVVTSDWFGLRKDRFEKWIWGRMASTGWRTDKLHAQDAGWPG